MIYSFMGMTYCPGCMGTGKCQMCHGVGSIVVSGNTNTGVGSVNGQTVVVPVHGNGNNGSNGGTSSNSRVCRVCNGIGLKISETWMGSQTSQRKWCSICGKYVLQPHQHVRCDNCNGTGRVKYWLFGAIFFLIILPANKIHYFWIVKQSDKRIRSMTAIMMFICLSLYS